MHDFFNFDNTATDQHDHHHHDHDTAGSDVGPNDGNNANSESTHDDEERNHHHQEKEPKDMNRTIKNSSAPILTGFALSMMFILSSAFTAAAFDKVDFNSNDFNNVFATADFRVGNPDFDRVAQSFKADAITRFNYDKTFNSDDRNFAFAAENEFTNFRDNDFAEVGDANFVDAGYTNFTRFDVDQIIDRNNQFADFYGKNSFRFNNARFNAFGNDPFLGFDNGDINVIDDFQFARVDFYNIDSFYADGFGSRGFVA